jgi:hypothetical protein
MTYAVQIELVAADDVVVFLEAHLDRHSLDPVAMGGRVCSDLVSHPDL